MGEKLDMKESLSSSLKSTFSTAISTAAAVGIANQMIPSDNQAAWYYFVPAIAALISGLIRFIRAKFDIKLPT